MVDSYCDFSKIYIYWYILQLNVPSISRECLLDSWQLASTVLDVMNINYDCDTKSNDSDCLIKDKTVP